VGKSSGASFTTLGHGFMRRMNCRSIPVLKIAGGYAQKGSVSRRKSDSALPSNLHIGDCFDESGSSALPSSMDLGQRQIYSSMLRDDIIDDLMGRGTSLGSRKSELTFASQMSTISVMPVLWFEFVSTL
jgi:hypothetical protein